MNKLTASSKLNPNPLHFKCYAFQIATDHSNLEPHHVYISIGQEKVLCPRVPVSHDEYEFSERCQRKICL